MKERFFIGFLLTAVLLVYGNTLANQFTMDDGLYIEHNPQVTNPSINGLFLPNRFSNVFRPAAFATLALNWALGGGQPAGYHLFNVMLHASVTWLLYRLLQGILGDSPNGKAVSFVSAMLFAVHPIHTEAVASAVGRAELLAAALLLAAWIFHLPDREIAGSPGYASAWSARAAMRYKRHQIELARADVETALRLNPSDIEAQTLIPILSCSTPDGSTR